MEFLAFMLVLPILIPLWIIGFIIQCALSNKSHKRSRSNYHYSYRDYECYDEYEDYDDYADHHPEPEEVHQESGDSVFDGGIPMGDSTLYLTDDDDYVAELGDAFI